MKKILICVLILLAAAAAVFAANAEPAIDVTSQCKFLVSQGKKSGFTDGSYKTAWTPKKSDPLIRVMLPEGGADTIEIGWKTLAGNFTMTEYDASQNQTHVTTAADEPGHFLTQTYPLADDTQYVFLTFAQSGQGVCSLRFFKGDELPATVNHWKAQNEKCDLMVISTHQDDEWLWFGGIIPYYDLVQGKNVQVLYMANCGRYRYQEALNALSVAGINTMPIFLNLKDERVDSLKKTVSDWGGSDHILELLAEQIRKYKPEIILTHDWNGEYGHNQHKATSQCMQEAIEAAADQNRFPASAYDFGAWQVKKLYRHLETNQQIIFDWHIPYTELGGRTCLQTADDAMNQNVSQLKWYHVEDHGQYDNSVFGLSYSVVGDDVEHKDLFENIG